MGLEKIFFFLQADKGTNEFSWFTVLGVGDAFGLVPRQR